MVIRSRAPVRIDFAGGRTDVALFTEESKGFVINPDRGFVLKVV